MRARPADDAVELDAAAAEDALAFRDGFYPAESNGRWMAQRGVIELSIVENAAEFFLEGDAPRQLSGGVVVDVEVGGASLGRLRVKKPGPFAARLALDPERLRPHAGRTVQLTLSSSETFVPAQSSNSLDGRILSLFVQRVGFRSLRRTEPTLPPWLSSSRR